MRSFCILLLAAVASFACASGADASWGQPTSPGSALNNILAGSAGAPLPAAGAGLPLLAAAGVYYAMRRLRRD